MKNYFRTLLSLFVIVFLGCIHAINAQKKPIACAESNGLTNAEMASILEMHNTERQAAGIRELVWDCGLAAGAQGWVSRGVVGHQDTYLGENIFVGSDAKMGVIDAFSRWNRERENWMASTKTCTPGKTCNHYSQIISPESERIGCGINRATPGKWVVFLVCNYDPPGNQE